jgi:acetoin utilization deacetylase AcuC-like enzyme
LLAVSAGFDTYEDDPLTSLGLVKESYRKIAEKIRDLTLPRFAVLEGGYSSSLAECIYNFVESF